VVHVALTIDLLKINKQRDALKAILARQEQAVMEPL
jgi:hypothetical protein